MRPQPVRIVQSEEHSMSGDEIPEFGASATFGFDGHLQSAEVHVEVPGAAEGSDPLQYEHDFRPHHDDPATDPILPSWLPGQHHEDPPLNIFDLPPHAGWHRDALGIEHPDIPGVDHEPGFDLHMRHDETEPEPHHETPDEE
jgi:hypothetical protein